MTAETPDEQAPPAGAPVVDSEDPPPMEIHKPHAAKTWREFFIEIGTIVIGILIALALEQTVDALHKRWEREEATASVRAEMQEAMELIHNRDLSEKCIVARIDAIQRLLSEIKAGRKPAAPIWIGVPPRWIMPVSRWDFTASSGRLSLLATKEQENLTELHRRIREMNDDLLQEQTDWAQLRVFEWDADLSPQELAAVNAALQDARYRNKRIGFSMRRADDVSGALDIHAKASSDAGTKSICLPFGTSAEDARKVIPPTN